MSNTTYNLNPFTSSNCHITQNSRFLHCHHLTNDMSWFCLPVVCAPSGKGLRTSCSGLVRSIHVRINHLLKSPNLACGEVPLGRFLSLPKACIKWRNNSVDIVGAEEVQGLVYKECSRNLSCHLMCQQQLLAAKS